MDQTRGVFIMKLFFDHNKHAGQGIEKNDPKKTGLGLFFDILKREWFELIKLNLLFLLFCLPVITIPAAYTAMCKITITMVRDKNFYLLSDFWQAFRLEFHRSTVAGLICFVCAAALAYASVFYYSRIELSVHYAVFAIVCAFGLLTALIASFYIFSMIASVSLNFVDYFKNSILLTFIYANYNLLTITFVFAVVVVILVTLPYSILFVLFFALSLTNLAVTFCACHALRRYVVREDTFWF